MTSFGRLDQRSYPALLNLYFRLQCSEKPIVATVLDGSPIREVLADEDDFAVLAESLFTKLDADENGKLSRSELEPALLQLGVELGVPTAQGEHCSLLKACLHCRDS